MAGVVGLRWSELVGLRVGSVNFLARTVTISETISEVGGRPRGGVDEVEEFRANAQPAHLHRRRVGGAPAPVPGGSGPGRPRVHRPRRRHPATDFAARVFNPAVVRAGLPDELTFHGLRHVAASFLVDAGEHPRVIQHRLGHATARLSMELYAHVPEATDRDVATHLDARFTAGNGIGGAGRGAQPSATGE